MNVTAIGHASTHTVTLRGHDLAHEVLGKMDFVEALVLCVLGRRPRAEEKRMIDAILVVALDHGLTPPAIAARMAYLGAPESLAGAVAAGLLGAGSRFLGPASLAAEQFAGWTAGLTDGNGPEAYARLARELAAPSAGTRFVGFGHPVHTEGDPRVPALRRIAQENGFHGKAWRLADAIVQELERQGRRLPLNAAGGTTLCVLGMGLEPRLATCLALIGRCGGLVAHILEESAAPLAQDAWRLIDTQFTAPPADIRR